MDFKKMSDDAPPQVVVATVNDSANGLAQMYSDLDPFAAKLKAAAKVLLVLSVLRLGEPGGFFGFLSALFVLCFAAPGSLGTAYSARWVRILAILSAIFSACALFFGLLVGMHFILMPDAMATAVCPSTTPAPIPKTDQAVAGLAPKPVQARLAPDFLKTMKADSAPLLGQDGHGLAPLPNPPIIGAEGHVWSASDSKMAYNFLPEGHEVEEDAPSMGGGRRLHETQFEHTHARGGDDDDDDEDDHRDHYDHHNHHDHYEMDHGSHFHMLHHLLGPSHEACRESLDSMSKAAPFLLSAWGLVEVSLLAAAVCTARRALKITKKARACGANAM